MVLFSKIINRLLIALEVLSYVFIILIPGSIFIFSDYVGIGMFYYLVGYCLFSFILFRVVRFVLKPFLEIHEGDKNTAPQKNLREPTDSFEEAFFLLPLFFLTSIIITWFKGTGNFIEKVKRVFIGTILLIAFPEITEAVLS